MWGITDLIGQAPAIVIELEDPNGTLHPNTFGTTSHVTSFGFAGTVTYENMLPGQYVIRATDVNGCEIWMGVVMN